MKTKAVIFTHINAKATSLLNPVGLGEFYQKQGSFFRSCLSCGNVGLVFVYVSYGMENYLNKLGQEEKNSRAAPPIDVPFEVIAGEERIFNALHLIIDRAIDDLNQNKKKKVIPVSSTNKFVFVGVRELASLLNTLWKQDPQLIANLSCDGKYTYDSPKFIEAIIRLARSKGDIAAHPVLRVDADVEVNETAIQEIIDRDKLLRNNEPIQPYWWFSGCYSGVFPNDPVNTHAVRMHWLVMPSTWQDPKKFVLQGDETLLRDLGELGATQVATTAACSKPCRKLIENRKGISLNRSSPQVISGAGLISSVSAIKRLPPFMNAKEMIVWIDDHLKRQLHESIGDLRPAEVERIDTATLRQDRHPQGIGLDDIDWARENYFRRLLDGCLMQATIKGIDGNPGPLAKWVKGVVYGVRPNLSKKDEAILRNELKDVCAPRYDEVLEVWRSADYGNDILKEWASGLTNKDKGIICSAIADVGVSYIKLLLCWSDYVAAIGNLSPSDAYWLFSRVR